VLEDLIKSNIDMQRLQGILPFDKDYSFYFDETNNIRKFILNPLAEDKVNIQKGLQVDFILGGICFYQQPNVDELFEYYVSQGIDTELKSKHLFRYNDFANDFKSERVTKLLDWLIDEKAVYLHYSIQNNLYYSLVDIVDSLLLNRNDMLCYIFELKDALYRLCKIHQSEVLEVLCKYQYPNVPKASVSLFCQEMSDIICSTNVANNDIFIKMLVKLMKDKKAMTDMSFIVDNDSFLLINGYCDLYLNRMMTFKNSILCFDEEKEVITKLNKIKCLDEIPRIKFVDSKKERYVQISDCIIACLSKTFQYLDSIDANMMNSLNLDKAVTNNLKKLLGLMKRSDEKNVVLIQNINAISLINDRMKKLMILCN